MKNVIFLTLLCCVIAHTGHSQTQPDSVLPVRGFCIGAPSPAGLNEFIKFIDQELAPRKVNTLILRVDYDYQYQSHPELSDANGLSKADIKKLVAVCKKNHIRLIPQFNLLGHQSWAGQVFALLTKYPQFDETPWVKMPEKYAWPNPDGLYCKSYCPLAPGLHKVVFEVIDELCDVFETTAFHAGMDEVFYIGEAQCPRCGGRDKAELYAGEVATLRNHLADKGRQLWIWGDRLLDGKTTGLGMWEASMNNTSRAVDLIPKDVMICDWHYDRPEKTPVYFAMKGLNVITCPWRKPEFARQQVNDMIAFRNTATPEMKERYQGMMQTVWSNAESFMDEYYGRRMPKDTIESASRCFRVMYKDIDQAIGSN